MLKVRTKIILILAKVTIPVLLMINQPLFARETITISLQKAIELALKNNNLLNIREYQITEKQAKVMESRIKALPSVIASSAWQYNQKLGHLTIEKGSLGSLPLSQQLVIPLPADQLNFQLSEHKNFNAGVTLYQPITQLAKIKSGVDVSKTELKISETEKEKSALQISQSVEKLYYGLLINGKQQEEVQAKLELAKIKLHDAESALNSGKTIEVSRAGFLANIADEEQNLLKLEFQSEDYMADFRILTGLQSDQILLEPVDLTQQPDSVSDIQPLDSDDNKDLTIARLSQTRAEQSIQAARWGYLPDFGIMAGYAYQTGNKIYPEQNPFVGASFKWNLQDIFSNRQLVNQRQSQLLQAREQLTLTEKQVNSDIEKVRRKLIHARALISVTLKAVTYRTEDLKIQEEKQTNGLNTPSDVLNAKAMLARAEADLLSSHLNYRMVITEFQMLNGK